jgi:RNA recognition motif-containing protein
MVSFLKLLELNFSFTYFFIMNIFIANLNYKVREEKLRDLFAAYGEVTSARIIMDRNSGRSKGYGFVEMPDETEALHAIEQLNDSDLEERKLVVKASEERSEPKRFTNRRPSQGR